MVFKEYIIDALIPNFHIRIPFYHLLLHLSTILLLPCPPRSFCPLLPLLVVFLSPPRYKSLLRLSPQPPQTRPDPL